MKSGLLLLLSCAITGALMAQDADTSYWSFDAVGTAGFTNSGQTVYWQAGGITSQAISGRIDFTAVYGRDNTSWHNDLVLALGAIRQGSASEARFIKNQDRIELTSKAGRLISESLNIAALLGFRTQFFDGFVFPVDQSTVLPSDTVSAFLSPAYAELGLGVDYQTSENFSVFYSPLSAKFTIVSAEEYRPLYIPQEITTGPIRSELGSNLRLQLKHTIAEHILFTTRANFFLNYLQDFPTVDVNWETLTTARINNWFAVSFATNLVYDKDILFNLVDDNGLQTGEQGPAIQFQHIVTLGLTYAFF